MDNSLIICRLCIRTVSANFLHYCIRIRSASAYFVSKLYPHTFYIIVSVSEPHPQNVEPDPTHNPGIHCKIEMTLFKLFAYLCTKEIWLAIQRKCHFIIISFIGFILKAIRKNHLSYVIILGIRDTLPRRSAQKGYICFFFFLLCNTYFMRTHTFEG